MTIEIKFTVPDAATMKRITDAFAGMSSIPVDGDGNPVYTDSEWARFRIREYVKSIVKRHERQEAERLIEIVVDDIIE